MLRITIILTIFTYFHMNSWKSAFPQKNHTLWVQVPVNHSLPYIHIGQGRPSFRADYFHREVGLEPWFVKTRERLPGICLLKLGRRQISVTEFKIYISTFAYSPNLFTFFACISLRGFFLFDNIVHQLDHDWQELGLRYKKKYRKGKSLFQ